MSCTECVVLTFITARKTRQATQLTQAGHALAPARQNFVRVSLMAHIPHDAIFWGVENIVQGHGEFYGAQVGT